MNWYRFIAYSLVTISFIIIVAARHKTQPTIFGQIIKEIAFLFAFDLLLITWVPIPFGLSLYIISRLNNKLIWNIKDDSIRKKLLFSICILCINFLFIHAQETLYEPGTFGPILIYYFVPIVIGFWLIVRLLFVAYRMFFWISNTQLNLTQWAAKISHWRIGFVSYCLSGLIGLGTVLLCGFIVSLTNRNVIGILVFNILHIVTIIYSVRLYLQIPRYCPPQPTLNHKKNYTNQIENTPQSFSEEPVTGGFKADEMTDLSPDAKYRFQGFIGGEFKPMDKPTNFNYQMPTSCPICKNILTLDGICHSCNKKICPRCFNAESLNALDCRNCGFIFEKRKKVEL